MVSSGGDPLDDDAPPLVLVSAPVSDSASATPVVDELSPDVAELVDVAPPSSSPQPCTGSEPTASTTMAEGRLGRTRG